ncbi:celf1, partial [Symbiodinium sp. KB8]
FMLVPTVGMPAPGGLYTSPGMYGQGVGMPFMAPAGMPAGPPAGQVGSICRAFPLVKPGSPIQVGAQAQGPAGANVFIFHLPNDMSNTDLYHYFLPFGPVLSARIIVDRTTGRSKGYGFVSFSQPEHAAASIASLDGTRIGHKRLKVTLKHEKGSGDSGKGRQGTAAGAAAAGHRKAAPAGSPPQP